MTAQDLIEKLTDSSLTHIDDVIENIQSAIYALEDGAALTYLGVNDDDQGIVEEAHNKLKAQLKRLIATKSAL